MSNLENKINIWLEIARWTTATTTGMAGFLALRHIFLKEWRQVQLRWKRNHIVVCGLSETALSLAKEFRHKGHAVVAIDDSENNSNHEKAERNGIIVYKGNVKNIKSLQAVNASRATHILAVSSEDDKNIAAMIAAQKLYKKSGKRSECHGLLMVTDPILQEQARVFFDNTNPNDGFEVKVVWLSMPELIARRTFEYYPLDFDGIGISSPMQVHLIIIDAGTSDTATKNNRLDDALITKALQLGHFANHRPLRLSLIGPNATKQLEKIKASHPFCNTPWYEANTYEIAQTTTELTNEIIKLISTPDQYITIVITPPDGIGQDCNTESSQVALAMDMAREITKANENNTLVRILVHLYEKTGLGELLKSISENKNSISIHPYGMFNLFCNCETFMHEEQDNIAKALHDNYRKKNGGKSWGALPEKLRHSNRQSADHIAVKLRAIGLKSVKKNRKNSAEIGILTSPSPEAKVIMDNLSQTEHSRWCAERWLSGWQLGCPKDDKEKEVLKINKNLVPWDQLDQNERDKDTEMIHTIPEALKNAKYSIIPIKGRYHKTQSKS